MKTVSGTEQQVAAPPLRRSRAARALWIALGFALLALGLAGVVLPLLPGTVFLILAAACFARGSPRLEAWLLAHPRLGPAIVGWRRDGAIPPRAKLAALAGMALSMVLVAASGAPPVAIGATGALLIAAAAYIGTRPSGPRRPLTPL